MKAFKRHVNSCFCSVLLFSSASCFAHNWPVHQAITGSAYQYSDGLQTFISENLETNANALLTAPQPQIQGGLTVSNWLTMGSKMEDEQVYLFTWRPLDHFYTVVPSRTRGRVIGLTDFSEPILFPALWVG